MFVSQTHVNIEITVNRFEQLLLEKNVQLLLEKWCLKKNSLTVLIRQEFGTA